MELGVVVRNMGGASRPDTLLACARAAEDAGLESVWVTDHIAIPPDDAEGSGGRYLDPLAALSWLAGATRRIRLGTGVLVLPYRPPLATLNWIATLQELSGDRLLLGVGVGWMKAEFRAAGVPRTERGARSDAVLDLLQRAFDAGQDDVVVEQGQLFLFRPRPVRPPVYVGGAGEHALARVLRFGDGWMPMGGDPARLAEPFARLKERAREAGRPAPALVCLSGLPLDDPARAAERLASFAALGASRLVCGLRYEDEAGFRRGLDALVAAREGAAR